MAIEIVDFPMKNGGSFHSYVSLPEGYFFLQFGDGHSIWKWGILMTEPSGKYRFQAKLFSDADT